MGKDNVSYDEPTSKKKRPSSNDIGEEKTNAIENEKAEKQEKIEEKEMRIEVEDDSKEDADVEDEVHESFHDSEKTESVPMISDTEEQVRSENLAYISSLHLILECSLLNYILLHYIIFFALEN